MSSVRRQTCGQCGAAVVFARQDDGKTVVLERCQAGQGNVAIQMPLLQGGRAQVVSVRSALRTSYRRHIDTCPRADFYRTRWKSMSSIDAAREAKRKELQKEIDRRELEHLADKIVETLGPGAAVSFVEEITNAHS